MALLLHGEDNQQYYQNKARGRLTSNKLCVDAGRPLHMRLLDIETSYSKEMERKSHQEI